MKSLVGLTVIAALSVLGLGDSAAFGSTYEASLALAPGQGADGMGSKIAFTRLREDFASPETTELLEAEIWVMNGDGSDPRPLTDNTTWDIAPVWSPGGMTVAFYGVQFDAANPLGPPLGPPHIFLIDAATGAQTQLTELRSRFPSWSPNGAQIAFDNGSPTSGDIFVINADGSGAENLTNSPAQRNIRPDWSPDGQKIAFTSRRDGDDEIYVMNADGSGLTQLTFNQAADVAPAWSPNGGKIAFQSNRDGNVEIYFMNADGSDQTRLTDYPGRDQDPDWSADGRKIAFERDIEPIQEQILELFVMDADGSGVTPLTSLPSENGHPGWGRGPALVPQPESRV
jgi:Tol biopolymer transport system component